MHKDPTFKIRFSRIEDTNDIVEIFMKNYNKSYIYENYLDPDLLAQTFKTQKPITIVAEYQQKIIGHIALVPFNNKYEIGRFLVSPGYKDLGVGKIIYKKLCEYIAQERLCNIFTECVTTNGRSSNISFKNHLRAIGFGLGLCKNFYKESPPRETMQYLALPSSLDIKESFSTYNHPVLSEISNTIYQYHNISRKICFNITPPTAEKTLYTISYDERNHRVSLILNTIGKDLKKVFSNLCSAYTDQGEAIINCEINTRMPDAPYAIEILTEIGFLFSFLWPNFIQQGHYTDLLCMQYITVHNEFSLDSLDIPNKFAQHLLDMIQALYAKS